MVLHRPSGNQRLGLGLAAITMIVWSVLPLVLNLLLDVMHPPTIVWYRFVFSTLLLGLALRSQGSLPRLGSIRRSEAVLLLLATSGLAVNYITYLLGLDYTSPATSQVLIQLGPLLLALGGIVVFREHFTRTQWVGFTILLVGLGVFFGGQLAALPAESSRFTLGSLTIVAAAATWAVFGMAQKQLLLRFPPQTLMLCIYAGCAVSFTPLARPSEALSLDAIGWAALCFGSLATVVAYGCFSAALAHVEATRVSAVLALVPLGTLVAAVLGSRWAPSLVPEESLSMASLAGAIAVVTGSLTTALGGASPEVSPEI